MFLTSESSDALEHAIFSIFSVPQHRPLWSELCWLSFCWRSPSFFFPNTSPRFYPRSFFSSSQPVQALRKKENYLDAAHWRKLIPFVPPLQAEPRRKTYYGLAHKNRIIASFPIRISSFDFERNLSWSLLWKADRPKKFSPLLST